MGEGGALVFQKDEYQEKAEILREKGTDRSKFFRGQVDKYRWIDYGSSYLPSEMNAAYLYAQLEECEKINHKRHEIYDYYHANLKNLEDEGKIQRPFVPEGCVHNAHMYGIPLCSAAQFTGRREIRQIQRRGCIYNERERASGASSDVLRPLRDRYGIYCRKDTAV